MRQVTHVTVLNDCFMPVIMWTALFSTVKLDDFIRGKMLFSKPLRLNFLPCQFVSQHFALLHRRQLRLTDRMTHSKDLHTNSKQTFLRLHGTVGAAARVHLIWNVDDEMLLSKVLDVAFCWCRINYKFVVSSVAADLCCALTFFCLYFGGTY